MADPKTYTQDEFDAAVSKATAPLIAKRDELMDEVKGTRREMGAMEKRVAQMEQDAKGQKAGITSEELTKLRSDVRADYDKEYAPFKVNAEKLAAENRTLKLDNVVKAELLKGGARPDRVEALFKLKQDEFDLTDDGKPMLKNRKGTPVEKFVGEDLRAEFPEFYTGTGSRGGGAAKSAAGGGNTSTIASDDGKAFLSNLAGIISGDVRVA